MSESCRGKDKSACIAKKNKVKDRKSWANMTREELNQSKDVLKCLTKEDIEEFSPQQVCTV